MHLRPSEIAFEREYRERRRAGAEGLYDSYDSDIAHLGKLLQSEHAPKGGRALEIGCGAGNLTLWLAARDFSAAGIDSAPSAIAWARERAAQAGVQADFKVGDAARLRDFFAEPFDLIVDGACFHFILGDDRGLFLRQVYGLLGPSGLFVLESLCSVGEGAPRAALEETRVGGRAAVRHIGTVESLVGEVRAAGFYVAHLEVTFYRDAPTRGDLTLLAVRPPG